MEFAWNTQKNGIADVKGLEKEQERDGKISNKEIDLKKTHLNYDLVQSELNLYQRVKQRVDEVRPVSRVQKNSVVDYSNIITVPQDQFKTWGVEKSKEYLKEVYNYFCEEFGKENVVAAKVHLDETTPHMHLHFVPVSTEGKLQARKVMTPKRINEIHSKAPKYLQERGFDVVRGMGKTDKSLEINEYKAKKVQEKIDSLENELKTLTDTHKKSLEELKQAEEKTRNKLNATLKASDSLSKLEEHTKGVLGRLDSIEAKKTLFGGKLTISEHDYSELISLAKVGESKVFENLQLKSKVGELQRKLDEKGLDEEMTKAKLERLNDVEYKYLDLQKRYRNLNNGFEVVEKALDRLDITDTVNKEMKAIRMAEKSKRMSFDMER
ncbi:MobV family relaxase [Clostridium sp. ZBS14]|uniref:MobV family relaxase n=1 Tax=Clostridium sp. ZBS14 TaxID=2949970 RepID=UPI002079F965|nr:MobV family relaxase [Clostridium sp. ZBS14]